MSKLSRGAIAAAFLDLCALLAFAFVPPARAADAAPLHWIGTWAAALQPPLAGEHARFRDETLRLVVHASAGGEQVRVRLSNRHGTTPLEIGAARIARRTAGPDVDPATDRPLRFAGAASVRIAAGAEVLSDPVALDVPAAADLAVSLYLPKSTPVGTLHLLARQTSYVSRPGDASAAARLPVARTIASWPFLAGVDVATRDPQGASVVAFGDSTVDGDGATPDANRRWPDRLAERLQAAGATMGVLNAGLIGNRLLYPSPTGPQSPFGPGLGEAGVERFARDALAAPGVVAVVVRIGGNDLGFAGTVGAPGESPDAAQLEAGLRLVAARARQAGVRVVGTTLPPCEGAAFIPGYWTPAKERVRLEVNAWLRAASPFDALVDVDALLRDPSRPSRLRPEFDSGDHGHPNDRGYAAIADAMPLDLLRGR